MCVQIRNRLVIYWVSARDDCLHSCKARADIIFISMFDYFIFDKYVDDYCITDDWLFAV